MPYIDTKNRIIILLDGQYRGIDKSNVMISPFSCSVIFTNWTHCPWLFFHKNQQPLNDINAPYNYYGYAYYR